MNIITLLFLVFNFISCVICSKCYWNSGCPYRFFSRETPYAAIQGDIRDSLVKIKGCEPVSIWGLLRHGKDYPATKYAKLMKQAFVIKDHIIESYDKGNSTMCAQDIDYFRTWKPDEKMFSNPQQLTEEGYQESSGLGTRYKQAFPKLFENLDTKNYTIRPALAHSVEDSIKAFVKSLQNENLVIDKVNEDFDVMAPYINCQKYMDEVLLNPKTYVERANYRQSPEYLAMKDRLERRLGLSYSLTDVNITSLYDLCRFTWSETSYTHPWCSVFSTEDLKILEYVEDLITYYKNGYGSAMNEKFGKLPMATVFKQFQEVKEGNGKKVAIYFSKGSAIEMILTALNLFKDDKTLTGAGQDPDRKWRNNRISSYSSNMLIVLNSCESNEYNVVFYLNEEPLTSMCKEGICTWQEFEDKFKSFTNANRDFC